MKCICDSCAKRGSCVEQFMLRHIGNLMQEHVPGDTSSGGPGDTPWTYEDWGLSAEVSCKHYESAVSDKLPECVQQIAPHKLRIDFTAVTNKNKERLCSLRQRKRDFYVALCKSESTKRSMSAQHEADRLTYITDLSADEIKSVTGKYPSWY